MSTSLTLNTTYTLDKFRVDYPTLKPSLLISNNTVINTNRFVTFEFIKLREQHFNYNI